ncbi:MAG: hypothetical protein AAFV19_19835 [Pseudomonadota bacterium]
MGADIFSYNTPHPDLASVLFSQSRLSAARYTRFDESFCGIAIARNTEHSFDEVDDRADLAERLHAALSTGQIGGVVGEGHGLGHVYIDQAVTDIPVAIAVVEAELGRSEIAGPAWFRFHEAGLEERVVPLTPATRQ